MAKNKWPCPGKPEALKNQPIGMYHCEYCGEMQMAGMAHLPPQNTSQWEEPFPKVEDPVEFDAHDHRMTLLTGLDWAAQTRDSAKVRQHLDLLLKLKHQDVFDALYESRHDAVSKYILDHVNLDRDDEDNWIVTLKGEF